MGHLLHDDILALADELSLSSDDGLEELEVLDVAAVRLDAVHEVLHHLVAQLAAQLGVVLEDGAHRLSLQQLIREKISLNRMEMIEKDRLTVTPGVRNSSRCLWSRAWFCWLPRQKFCRNS